MRWWWWGKTIEMWWWWRRENNRNVVVEENNGILWPENLRHILTYSQSTFCSWGVDMSWFCSVCEKSFSRKDSMHVMSKHRNAGLTPFQTVLMFSQKFQWSRFEHPFTSMITRMTGSGKTAWVRSLLQQASETIYPWPRRGSFGDIHNGSLRIHKC